MPGNCMNDVIAKIPQQEENMFFHVFPNPASNKLTVDLGDLQGVNTTIKIYDLIKQTYLREAINFNSND